MSAPSNGWLNKVPEVTLSFWIIKIMTTTVGETFADFLAVDVGWGLGITSVAMALLLGAALALLAERGAGEHSGYADTPGVGRKRRRKGLRGVLSGPASSLASSQKDCQR